MRRTKEETLYEIVPIFPLFFWHKCDICGDEFKQEFGWKIKFPTTRRIICSECAKYYMDVKELALTWGETGGDKPSIIRSPKYKPRI